MKKNNSVHKKTVLMYSLPKFSALVFLILLILGMIFVGISFLIFPVLIVAIMIIWLGAMSRCKRCKLLFGRIHQHDEELSRKHEYETVMAEKNVYNARGDIIRTEEEPRQQIVTYKHIRRHYKCRGCGHPSFEEVTKKS